MARLIFKNGLTEGIKRYNAKVREVSPNAWAKTGIQLINFIVQGEDSGVTPPVLEGGLRASGSVFFENELIMTTKDISPEFGTPATSHNGKKNVVTVVFNKPYATRWHEDPFTPGPVSQRSGNVGNKYIENHLKDDRKTLMKFYALLINKEVK